MFLVNSVNQLLYVLTVCLHTTSFHKKCYQGSSERIFFELVVNGKECLGVIVDNELGAVA